MEDFLEWTQMGVIYAGSDGSVQNNRGAHGFGITSGVTQSPIWGGAGTTCGNHKEMASLRTEHAGAIAVIIILDIIQRVLQAHFVVNIWVDNAEVVRRMTEGTIDPLALDYDLYSHTITWLNKIKYDLTWHKVDSHIEKKLQENPTKKLNGNPLAWRLNSAVDGWAVDLH